MILAHYTRRISQVRPIRESIFRAFVDMWTFVKWLSISGLDIFFVRDMLTPIREP